MSEEPFALSTISPPSLEEEGDYDAICATVMASARGRWFLEEYARRNRNADTKIVLAAIERIESLFRGDRSAQAYHGIRAELLEMARAIAETSAEVAGEPAAGAQDQPAERDTKRPTARSEIFAMAERLHDVAWTMRERGLDPATCAEIETLASSILAASSLQDPADHRAQKLKEVLQYLERRIGGMLDAGAQAGSMPPEQPAENAAPADNGSASDDAGLDARLARDAASTDEPVALDNGDVRPEETGLAARASVTDDPPVEEDPWQPPAEVHPPPPDAPSELTSTDPSNAVTATKADAPAVVEENIALQAAERAIESFSADSKDAAVQIDIGPLVVDALIVDALVVDALVVEALVDHKIVADSATAAAAAFSVEATSEPTTTQTRGPTCAADETDIGAAEIDVPPLLATAVELPSDTSDSSGELQLDPLVIEPPPAAVAALTPMSDVAKEPSSPSEAAPEESSPTILVGAVEPMIVEPTNSLETVATMTGGAEGTDSTSESAPVGTDVLEIEPLVLPAGAPSAEPSDAISPESSIGPASAAAAAAEGSSPLGEHTSAPAVSTNESAPQIAPQITDDLMAQFDLPATPAAPFAADSETTDVETVDVETVDVKFAEALEENRSAPADAAAAATTALMPSQQSEIGATAKCEPAPAEVVIEHAGVDRSEGDGPVVMTPEPCEATAAGGQHVVLHEGAGEMASPFPSRSAQSTVPSDPPAAKAAIASEDKTESSEERSAGHGAASPPHTVDIVHETDDLAEQWPPAVTQPQVEAAVARLAQQEPCSTCSTGEPALARAPAQAPAQVQTASMANSPGQPASIPASVAPAEALSQAGPSVAPQDMAGDTAGEIAVLAPSPFEQSGLTEEPITPIGSEANREASTERPAETPEGPSAEPVPTMPSASFDTPHEDILSGAWELAVSQPQVETAVTLPAQPERPPPGRTFDVLHESKLDIWGAPHGATSVESEEPALDPILDIEQELFVPVPTDSPREIAAEHFRAAPSAGPISGIPPRADAPPSPRTASPTTAPAPVEQIAVAPATTPAQPVAAAAPAAPARPVARPMPRAAPSDPLAALRAMTDEERIALFT